MKTNNNELNLVWDELEDIFENFKRFKPEIVQRLNRIGFELVWQGKHPKIYFFVNSQKRCVTICSTPSDRYAGRQILRQIRRIYENPERI